MRLQGNEAAVMYRYEVNRPSQNLADSAAAVAQPRGRLCSSDTPTMHI